MAENSSADLTFADWVKHEASRIPGMGLTVKNQADAKAYMEINIAAALRQAYRHGKAGKGETDRLSPLEP